MNFWCRISPFADLSTDRSRRRTVPFLWWRLIWIINGPQVNTVATNIGCYLGWHNNICAGYSSSTFSVNIVSRAYGWALHLLVCVFAEHDALKRPWIVEAACWDSLDCRHESGAAILSDYDGARRIKCIMPHKLERFKEDKDQIAEQKQGEMEGRTW